MMTAECVKTYVATGRIFVDDSGEVVGSRLSEDAGTALDRFARQYSVEHHCSYPDALERCMADPRHADLVAEYARSQPPPIHYSKLYAQREELDQKSFVGQELHAATARIMCEGGERDYSTAFQIALKRNPGLTKRYAEVV